MSLRTFSRVTDDMGLAHPKDAPWVRIITSEFPFELQLKFVVGTYDPELGLKFFYTK